MQPKSLRKNRAKRKTQNKMTTRTNSNQNQPHSAQKRSKSVSKWATPLGTRQELDNLRKIWYAKLKAEGFKDLEVSDLKPHRVNNGPLMGRSLQSLAKHYNPETELHYKRITHYLTHNLNPMADRVENQVVKMFHDGISYREITRQIREQGDRMNIHRVHHIIKRFLEKVRKWNVTNPMGVDFDPDFVGRRDWKRLFRGS